MSLIEISSPFPRYKLLTLNLPEKRNPLTADLVEELKQKIGELAEEDTVKVVSVTGSGSAFCAGADLDALRKMRNSTYEENEADSRSLAELFLLLWNFPKPLIGLINGSAIAGGLGLLTTFDYCIAADDPKSKFGFSEVRIGFVPAIVSNFLLRKLPGHRARWLLLSGEIFGVEEAEEFGLIQQLCPPEELLAMGEATAEKLIKNNSLSAMKATKRLINSITEVSINEGIEQAVKENAAARNSVDCQAGIAAFLEKKKLSWPEFEKNKI